MTAVQVMPGYLYCTTTVQEMPGGGLQLFIPKFHFQNPTSGLTSKVKLFTESVLPLSSTIPELRLLYYKYAALVSGKAILNVLKSIKSSYILSGKLSLIMFLDARWA